MDRNHILEVCAVMILASVMAVVGSCPADAGGMEQRQITVNVEQPEATPWEAVAAAVTGIVALLGFAERQRRKNSE